MVGKGWKFALASALFCIHSVDKTSWVISVIALLDYLQFAAFALSPSIAWAGSNRSVAHFLGALHVKDNCADAPPRILQSAVYSGTSAQCVWEVWAVMLTCIAVASVLYYSFSRRIFKARAFASRGTTVSHAGVDLLCSVLVVPSLTVLGNFLKREWILVQANADWDYLDLLQVILAAVSLVGLFSLGFIFNLMTFVLREGELQTSLFYGRQCALHFVFKSGLALVLVFWELPGSVKLSLVALSALVMFAVQLYFLPFNDIKKNQQGCAAYACLFVVAVTGLVGIALPASFGHLNYALVPLMVAAVIASTFAPEWRLSFVKHILDVQLSATGECDVEFRFPADPVIMSRLFDLSNVSSDEQALLAALFAKAHMDFSEWPSMVLHRAAIVLFRTDASAMLGLLRNARGMSTELEPVCWWYTLSVLRQHKLEQMLGESSQMFQREFRKARTSHYEALKHNQQFWMTFAGGDADSSQLPIISSRIEKASRRASALYESLLERFPDSVELLRSYADFHEDVLIDLFGALRLRELASDNNPTTGSSSMSSFWMGAGEDKASNSSANSHEPNKQRLKHATQMATYRRNIQIKISTGAIRALSQRTCCSLGVVLFLVLASYAITRSAVAFGETELEVLDLAGQRAQASQYIPSLAMRMLDEGRKGNHSYVSELSAEMRSIVQACFHYHTDVLPSDTSYEPLRVLMQDPVLEVREFSRGDAVDGAGTEMHMNLWDLGNTFIRRSIEIAHLSVEEISTGDYDWLFGFVVQNGPQRVTDGFIAATDLHRSSFSVHANDTKTHLYLLSVALVFTVTVMARVLFMPIFKQISKERDTVLRLFLTIPPVHCARVVEKQKKELGLHKTEHIVGDKSDDTDEEDAHEKEIESETLAMMSSSVEKTDILHEVPFRTWVTLGCVFLMVAGLLFHCFSVSQELLVSNSEVSGAILRRSVAMRAASNFEVLASAQHLGFTLNASHISDALRHDIHTLEDVHFALKFGSEHEDYELLGSRSALTHTLLYSSPCLDGSDCGNASSPSLVDNYGLDYLVDRFLHESRRLLELYETNTTHVSFANGLSGKLMRDKLNAAVRIAIQDSVERLQAAQLMQDRLLGAILVVLFLIYGLVFRPMVTFLSLESKRTLDLLLMIPLETVNSVPVIRNFMETGRAIEQDKVDDNLEEIRQQRKNIMDSMADSVIICDEQGVIHMVNRATTTMLGYDRTELLGHFVDVLMPLDVKGKHTDFIAQYTATGRSEIMGERMRRTAKRSNGSTVPVAITVTESIVGTTRNFVAVMKDVTAECLAERMRERQSQMVNEIVQGASDAIVVATERGQITLVNDATVDMFGYSEEECLKSNVKIFMPREVREKHDHYLENFLKGNRPIRVSIPGLVGMDKKLNTFPIMTKFSVLEIDGTKSFLAFIKNTAPTKLELIQRQKDEELRQVVSNVSDAIVIADGNGIISLVNEKCVSMFGYKKNECIGYNVTIFMPPEMKNKHDTFIADFMARKGPVREQVGSQGMHKGGRRFPVEIKFCEFDVGGRKRLLAFIKDMSPTSDELIRVEKEREMKTVLEQSSDAIVVADDIGTISLVNKECCELFGRAELDCLGKNVTIFMPPSVAARHDTFLANYKASGRPIRERIPGLTGMHSDGTIFPIETRFCEFRVSDGRTRYVSFIKDRTRELNRVEKEQEVLSIVEAAAEAIIVAEEDGTITRVNSACEKLFGYEQSTVVGENVKIFMPQRFAARHDDYLSKFKTASRPIRSKLPNLVGKHKCGREIPIETRFSTFKVGKKVRLLAFIKDNSPTLDAVMRQRKEAEIESIIQSTTEAIVTATENGIITLVNDATESLFGFTKEELMGSNVSVLMPEKFAKKHDDILARFRKSNEPIRPKIPNLSGQHKNGRQFPIATRFSEITVDGTRKLLAFITDTTPTTLQRDRESREREINEVLSASTDAVIVAKEDGTISLVNQATVAMFGYDQDECLGDNVKIFMPRRIAKRHDGFMRTYLGADRPIRRSIPGLIGRRKDGFEFPVEMRFSEFKVDEGRKFIALVKSDIKESLENVVAAVVEQTRECMLYTSVEGVIIFINKATVELLGHPADYVCGKNVAMFLPPKDRDVHMRAVEAYHRRAPRPLRQQKGVQAMHANGQLVAVDVEVTEVSFGGRRALLGILRPVG